MADFRTNLHRRFEDLLARFDDADGATASGRIGGAGEATSFKLSISTSRTADDGQTGLSSRLDANINGATFSANSDAAGESASTSLGLIANLQEKLAVAQVIAGATGDGADATASTDAAVGPGFEIVDFQQETLETPGGDPTAVSRTVLEAIQSESFAFDPLPLSEESAPLEVGDADWLF